MPADAAHRRLPRVLLIPFALVSGVLLLELALRVLDLPRLGDEPVAHLLGQLDSEESAGIGDVRLDPIIGVHPRIPSEQYAPNGGRLSRQPEFANRYPHLLLLGDSVVYRPGIFEPFADLLRERYAVFEGAVEGFDVRSEVEWLKRYAGRCEPDRVLLLLHVNDYWGNSQIFVNDSGELVHFHRRLGASAVHRPLLRWSRLYRTWLREAVRPADTSPEDLRESVARDLKELRDWCATRRVFLQVAVLPLSNPAQNEDPRVRGHLQHALATLEALGVPHLSLEPVIEEFVEGGGDPGEDAEHPTLPLAKRIASVLCDWVLEEAVE